MTSFEELKQREESLLCRTYGRYPLAVDSAQGSILTDFAGREYIDLLSGIGVTNLGHSHPALAEVLYAQAGKLVHLSNLFYQREQLELAEKLLAPAHFGKAFFCNSGAEANEAAIKLARRYAQRIQGRENAGTVLTLSGAFHGRTLGALAATGQARLQDGFAPVPHGFRQVDWGNIAALRAAMDDNVVAVLVEVVQGEGGIRPMAEGYAREVQALCRDGRVLFMVDEVQSGLCRTGRFWAFQHYGLEPDVLTSAKALANGLPMGAMLATDDAARGFELGSHATTFGAGALVSAVAGKVLDIMQQEDLAGRAHRVGEAFMDDIRAMAQRVPGMISEVRGLGLMIGIELTFSGKEVWQALLQRGFVVNLTQERVLRLLPALTVPKEHLRAFACALEAILQERRGRD